MTGTLDGASEAAIGWLVTLNSGAVRPQERRAFEAWLAANTAHARAWQRLAGGLDQALAPARGTGTSSPHGPLGQALSDALARADLRAAQRRRLLRGALGVGGVATATGLLWADRQTPVTQWAADLRTGTGERRRFDLPDGSAVTLDARSAADLDFRAGRRTVTLRAGALIAEAMPARPGEAPFAIVTPHGEVRALGTRFVVRDEGGRGYAGVLAHSVRVSTPQGAAEVLAEGQAARFSPGGVETVGVPAPTAAGAWTHGMFEAHDQPLGEVVQALRAYRRGFLRIAPEAAALRVYGTYTLDDTDRALAALAETLPIRVRVYQRGWLVVIERDG